MSKLDDPEWLKSEYACRSLQSIANDFGVHPNTVRNRLIKFGIERRKSSAHLAGTPKTPEHRQKMAEARRKYWETHPEKRIEMSERHSKHHLSVYGYRLVFIDGTAIKEHRLIVEADLGRKLLPSEIVHHKNGIRTDNRLENLEVMTRSEHSRLHWYPGKMPRKFDPAKHPHDKLGRFAKKSPK